MQQELIETITITPEGVEPSAQSGSGVAALVHLSSTEFQLFDRALRSYSGSDNKLKNASADLLGLCGVIVRLQTSMDLNTTRQGLARAIIDLKYKVVQMDYPPSVAENLCLLFAIVLDEFILLSPLGENSGWENRTLVADLFGFRDGGDRFYHITEKALMQPRALGEFLEIIYLFLKLGYKGKYSRGNEYESDRLIDRIETSLNLTHYKKAQSIPGRPIRDSRPPKSQLTYLTKTIWAGAAVLLMLALSWANAYLERSSILERFGTIRSDATSQETSEFIYSSETGTTKTKVGE